MLHATNASSDRANASRCAVLRCGLLAMLATLLCLSSCATSHQAEAANLPEHRYAVEPEVREFRRRAMVAIAAGRRQLAEECLWSAVLLAHSPALRAGLAKNLASLKRLDHSAAAARAFVGEQLAEERLALATP